MALNQRNTFGVKIENFEGPLDLLLQLIEDQEMDISQISLAEVTDQYIHYMDEIEKESPEKLADFLVVAAKLLYIKSKVLLPSMEIEEDAEELEYQLKIYREYLEASQQVQKIISKKKFAYFKDKPVITEPIFSPPQKLTTAKMAEFFRGVLGRLEPIMKIPERSIKKAISIKAKISEIKDLILSKAQLSFHDILTHSKDKSEKIVSFLALLELVKQKDITVDQGGLFTDININRLDSKNS